MAASASKGKNIQVFVRCRPLNTSEKKAGSASVVDVNTQAREVVVKERLGDKKFVFDRVFSAESTQNEVYVSVVSPLIEEVLMGYNCTVFAYGQTGTGKTHTMIGAKSSPNLTWEDDPGAGIIPQTLHNLYEALSQLEVEFHVKVSFLELYNEELYDLLAPICDASKLRILNDGKTSSGSVLVQGLEEKIVHNKEEVYNILEKGTERRRVGSTLMNDQSSRSHTVFTITIHMRESNIDGEDLLKIGKLNLVDLAGSECIGRSGAIDRRAREAGNINQSLLTLGRVITALVEKAPHVPYRESKLTRLLQDSLGGRTKTSIIATISPAAVNLEETLSTLDYAHRAKNIMNKPEINQKLTKKAVLREYLEEIERLKKDLVASRDKNGIYLDLENYEYLQNKVSGLSIEMKEKLGQIDQLKEQIVQLDELFASTKVELSQKERQLNHTTRVLDKTEVELKETILTLKVVTTEKDEQEYLVKHRMMIERELTEQAKKLIEIASETTNHVKGLYSKLDRKNLVELTNESKSHNFKDEFHNQVKKIQNFMADAHKQHEETLNEAQAKMDDASAIQSNLASQQISILQELKSLVLNRTNVTTQNIESHETYVKRWTEENLKVGKENKESVISSQQELCDGKASELLNKMFTLIVNQNKVVQMQQDLFLQNMKSTSNNLRTNLTNVQEQILEIKALEEMHSREICTETEILENKHKIIEDQRQNLLQTWKVQEEMLINTIMNTRSLLHGHDKSLEENLPQMLQSSRNIKDKTLSNTSAVIQNLDAVSCNAKNLAEEVDKNLGKSKEFVETMVSSVVSDEEMIKNECQEIKTIIYENLENLKSKVQSHEKIENEQCLNLDQEVSTTNNAVLCNLKELAHHTVRDIDTLTTLTQRVKAKSEEVALQEATSKQTLSKWSIETHDFSKHSVEESKEKVLDFIDGLAKDVPTGATPQRKEFAFPTDLIATSPHEKILERLRQSKAANTTEAQFLLPSVPQLELDLAAEILPLQRTSSLISISAFGSTQSLNNDSVFSAESNSSQASTPAASNDIKENKPVRKHKGIVVKTLKPPTSNKRTGRVLTSQNLTDRSISPK